MLTLNSDPFKEFSYGYILSPDGSLKPMPVPERENGTFTLIQMQNAVGGMIQMIQPEWLYSMATLMWPWGLTINDIDMENPHLSLLVNEEGVLQDLPPNHVAPRLVDDTVIRGNLVVIPRGTME